MEIKSIDEFILRELEITSNDPQVVQLARECKTCEEYVVKKLDLKEKELDIIMKASEDAVSVVMEKIEKEQEELPKKEPAPCRKLRKYEEI